MDILIIEDDETWQQQVSLMLEELPNVQLDFAATLEEARSKLQIRPPHLVIADVLLRDRLSFDLFQTPSRSYPVIFITSFTSPSFLSRALTFPSTTFLVKPFHALTLLAAIQSLRKVEMPSEQNKIVVLGKFKQKIALSFKDIMYIEADGNYVKICTINTIYSYKSALKELSAILDSHFLQIHKSFIVNTSFVNRMDLSVGIVLVKGKALPIGRAYRQQTITRLTEII